METELLLQVWREACRHIEIADSMDRIALLLAGHLPADVVAVRRLNIEREQLETVAVGRCRQVDAAELTRTSCAHAQFQRVMEWCAAGEARSGSSEEELLHLLGLPGRWKSALAVPLAPGEGQYGVLVAHSSSAAFDSHHEQWIRDLIEPLTVALANDTRLHELTRLREALEADKRALLTRLGRQELVDTVVGTTAGLREVMERVAQVARTDSPVLLLGETGTGKELVARAIHTKSRRASGPVIRVNCGALPPGLIDSELFGHERGSFTGAVAAHRGWFERADGGTLFLDEIGELSLEAQVRLLRILQDGTFERVGAHKPLTADVRLVTATNRDLRQMVSAGAFREDLWYRIAVFPIWIPPLRERAEDIPALAAHFAARTGVRLGGVRLVPSAEDVELLLAYDWPGNVRELAAVIERAAILGDAKCLRLEAALGQPRPALRSLRSPQPARRREVAGGQAAGVGPRDPEWSPQPARRREVAGGQAVGVGPRGTRISPAVETALPPQDHGSRLDQVVTQQIEQALVECRGRIEGPFGAAMRLGINPHTLRSRMRKLGIDWRRFRPGAPQRGTR